MTDVKQLITEHLDIWLTAETEKKSGRGRSSGSNTSIYGVQKLRELILDLAVHGKLISQVDSKVDVKKLIENHIQEKGLKIKKPFINDETLLPHHWVRVNLATIAEHNTGKTLDKNRNTGSSRPYITTSNLYWGRFELNNLKEFLIEDSELERCQAKKGDLLVIEGGDAGRSAIWLDEEPICFQNHIHRVRPFSGITSEYLYRCFEQFYLSGEIENYRQGVGIKSLSGKKLAQIPINLPPLEEQQRIVEKVDELMQLCDQLEQQQTLSSDAHATLVATLLKALTESSDADEFQDNWHRISANFDLLFTTENSIEQLKQTILQLAVMGKLVKQDPSDEPASELLKQIAEEKAKLVKEGKINKSTKKYSDPELEVNLPNKWLISVMNHLIFELDAGWSPACHSYPANHNNWGVLKTTAVQCNQFIENENKELPENLSPRQDAELKAGDILVTRAGPYNRVGVACYVEKVRPKLMISDKLIRIKYSQNHLDGTFIALAINFGQTALFLKENQSGMAESQVNISQDKLRSAPILLPPLLEQKRIVEKVNQLFSIIDQLHTLQTKARQTQLHLADVLVANAVEGA